MIVAHKIAGILEVKIDMSGQEVAFDVSFDGVEHPVRPAGADLAEVLKKANFDLLVQIDWTNEDHMKRLCEAYAKILTRAK